MCFPPPVPRDCTHAAPARLHAGGIYNTNLWRLDTRTGEREMLIGSTYDNRIPQYSPDGRKIAFQSNRSGNVEVWTCQADGSNCQQLTSFGGPQCGTPRWSPDGRWLALDSRSEGQPEIYVIAADGGTPRRMTNHPADDIMPSWSQGRPLDLFRLRPQRPIRVLEDPEGRRGGGSDHAPQEQE